MRAGSVLAIDLGTSGAKAAVVRPDGSLAGTGHAQTQILRGPGGAVEEDPDQVFAATLDAGAQAVAATTGAPPVGAVTVASQYSSLVPVGPGGAPTWRMITWLDQRCSIDALQRLSGGALHRPRPWDLLRWVRIHGIPPLDSGVDVLAKMRWLRHAQPDAYDRTEVFLEPADYLTMRLTGRACATQASAFMMLLTDNRDPDRTRWHPALVARSGIDPAKLPPLVDPAEPIGTVLPDVAHRLGIPAEALVFPAVNDTQAGALGSGAFRGDHAGLSIGTTAVLITDVPTKHSDIRNSLVTMPSPLPGQYLVLAEGGMGGQAIDHFLEHVVFSVDGFGDHTLEDKFAALHDAIAHVPPGSGGVLFLPWLSGSTSPAEDGRVRGGFLNMSLDTTREHLGRAVLEGVAFQLRWLRQAVEGFSGREMTAIRFYGGGALSPVWAQIIADIGGREIHRLADPRFVVARGAGVLGLVRTGQVAFDDTLDWAPVAQVHEPDRALHDRHEQTFEQFVRAFRRNRPIFRALNRAGGPP